MLRPRRVHLLSARLHGEFSSPRSHTQTHIHQTLHLASPVLTHLVFTHVCVCVSRREKYTPPRPKSPIPSLQPLIDGAADAVQKVAPVVGEAVEKAAPVVGEAVQKLQPALEDAYEKLQPWVKEVAQRPVQPLPKIPGAQVCASHSHTRSFAHTRHHCESGSIMYACMVTGSMASHIHYTTPGRPSCDFSASHACW